MLRKDPKPGLLVWAIALVFATCPTDAAAYIDPGTGSMLLQGLLAGVLTVAFTFKRWIRSLRNFFTRSTPPPSDSETPPPSNNGASHER